MSRRLVLWRHGRTEWNATRRFQGQIDVALDDTGRAQARQAAQQLAQLPPSAIVASDLSRAQDTAASLAALAGLTVQTDERLRETNAGSWQGLDRTELLAAHGPELAAWAGGSDLRPGGGERRSEVAQRMVEAIEDALVEVPSDGTLVVVTHGGAARAAVGQLLDLPIANWAILGVLTNCAWTVLSEQPPDSGLRWRLEEYNARSLPQTAFGDDR